MSESKMWISYLLISVTFFLFEKSYLIIEYKSERHLKYLNQGKLDKGKKEGITLTETIRFLSLFDFN
jgi:hypothetical protein